MLFISFTVAPCKRPLQLCVAGDVACCTRQLNRCRCRNRNRTADCPLRAANCCARCAALALAANGCRWANWCPVPPRRRPPRCCLSSARWAILFHPPADDDPFPNLSYISPQICVLARFGSGCTRPPASWDGPVASHCQGSRSRSSPPRCCTCAAS